MKEQTLIVNKKNKRHLKKYVPEKAFSRVAETHLSTGNGVRLLRDAAENYPAWLEAINGAEKYIHFECYIIHEDAQGKLFADALIAKAKEGVRVRVIYDWVGGFGKTSARYWENLRKNGIEVRCYNPLQLHHPVGWLSRDHRKTLIVDGEVAFVFGLCVGQMWVGYPEKNIEPWRDTGVELRGKSVAEVDEAFADIWAEMGEPLPEDEIADADLIDDAGDINLRVVAGKPGSARIYRLDQMIASMAQKTLWLTDAYFAGTNAYVQSLRAAAMDGVDVRLLVPQTTDIPLMRAVSLSGYRSLLEAGVKVYEWNGVMLHAKTAVADGFWSRVGSTNLNIVSWLSNCEIDVLIEDKNFGRQMEEMYLADLENATEIVLNARKKPLPVHQRPKRRRSLTAASGGSARYAPSAMVIGSAIGSSLAVGRRLRELGAMEAKIALAGGLLLLVLGVVALFWSKLVAIPFGIIALWFAVALFINSYQFYRQARRQSAEVDDLPASNHEKAPVLRAMKTNKSDS
jgi:cardiolipin synthase A/B